MKYHNKHAVLALGGGGARGIAHLGVVELLRACGIHVDHYVGVSMGSLAAAICSLDSDILAAQSRVISFLTDDHFQRRQEILLAASPHNRDATSSGMNAWYERFMEVLGSHRRLLQLIRRPSLLSDDLLVSVISALIPDIDLLDLPVPVTIMALDLRSGKEVALTEGSLRRAVLASMAIPGIFPVVEWEELLLCDVGVLDSVPARMARQLAALHHPEAELIVAVDVSSQVAPTHALKSASEVFVRLSEVAEQLIRSYSHGLADLWIRPDVGHIHWADFSQPQLLIDRGRAAFPALTGL